MQIRKILKLFLICIFCATAFIGSVHASGNVPYGDIGEYGNWITRDNMEKYNEKLAKAPATTSRPANSPSKAVENTDTKDDWQKQKEEKARIKKIQNRIS